MHRDFDTIEINNNYSNEKIKTITYISSYISDINMNRITCRS